uniref:Uncharacterized protein n=1 Tax=Chromera velia CCMP2878 TaxID=1169474 RepID=A0A0G4FKL1_9ALVE|eukprot:Cvel_17510.t1-p1 / transcript=Cvel_17510.t1 / gene=Cvel_17510 / organism=Chromera_velia_CCMP2878 / gene_product=hypothetical protein / transcript_product=hypothetical protein / location=Cvel_scaffold1403:7283-12175(+) / protein_length=274 / sequence_SO=supercontig / SO=protein_coding / is_pseudo=false
MNTDQMKELIRLGLNFFSYGKQWGNVGKAVQIHKCALVTQVATEVSGLSELSLEEAAVDAGKGSESREGGSSVHARRRPRSSPPVECAVFGECGGENPPSRCRSGLRETRARARKRMAVMVEGRAEETEGARAVENGKVKGRRKQRVRQRVLGMIARVEEKWTSRFRALEERAEQRLRNVGDHSGLLIALERSLSEQNDPLREVYGEVLLPGFVSAYQQMQSWRVEVENERMPDSFKADIHFSTLSSPITCCLMKGWNVGQGDDAQEGDTALVG